MTVLKWLLIVVSVAYACGLAVLFFVQRSFLFPIPTVVRTSPQQAGFPEAEEHILAAADGEVDAVHRLQASEIFRKPLHLQRGRRARIGRLQHQRPRNFP